MINDFNAFYRMNNEISVLFLVKEMGNHVCKYMEQHGNLRNKMDLLENLILHHLDV